MPRAAVSITGTTQPGIAKACLRPEYFECGLTARLLIAQPPARVRVWTEDDVSAATEEEWGLVVNKLLDLDFESTESDETFRLQAQDADSANADSAQPIDLSLTPEAKERYARFVNVHGLRAAAADEDTGAALAKLEGCAARVALIFHLVDAVKGIGGVPVEGPIGLDHVERGIQAAEWFANEAERVYALLREDPEATARRTLVDRIRLLGGKATPRDLLRHVHRLKNAGSAEAALDDLVKHNLGRWVDKVPGRKGGRPSRVFVLHDSQPPGAGDIDTTSESPGETEVSSMSTPSGDLVRGNGCDTVSHPGPREPEP